MRITSLGHRTNLIFSNFAGRNFDRGDYTVIQTPNNPGYHSGNYIIFDRPPRCGDHAKWTALFDREFPYYSTPHHYCFTWTGEELGEVQEFLQNDFELEPNVVLATKELRPPKHLNDALKIRPITSDEGWSEVVDLQCLMVEPKYQNSYYREFKEQQMENYRRMSDAGLGHWYGGFLEGKLVADLGIFHQGGLGRYQNVGTHPDFRNLGICGTLVYQAGLMALQKFKIEQLVIEADPDYHAARIYQAVGFVACERNYMLSWCRH